MGGGYLPAGESRLLAAGEGLECEPYNWRDGACEIRGNVADRGRKVAVVVVMGEMPDRLCVMVSRMMSRLTCAQGWGR